mmetsp:Transcript_3493/g.21959  ORF Transcript_3493/g.21959 Transcript_3493/m.21959 type:complete len:82 (+) Transcript_3493:1313-1558(+)
MIAARSFFCDGPAPLCNEIELPFAPPAMGPFKIFHDAQGDKTLGAKFLRHNSICPGQTSSSVRPTPLTDNSSHLADGKVLV